MEVEIKVRIKPEEVSSRDRKRTANKLLVLLAAKLLQASVERERPASPETDPKGRATSG